MKKGFTLIGLLAVIIILAIIALIATPIILNVINDARKSAGLSEASMILSGNNNYCATSAMKNQLDGSVDICNDDDGVTIDDVSKMVSLGNAEVLSVNYNGNKITELVIKSNSYTYKLCSNGTFVMENEECPRDPNSLITKLLNQYSEGASSGLVQDETNSNIYYYKGNNDEVANNYLWYGGHHWRVIEIDTDANTLLLISQQPLTAISPASEVWDTEEAYKRSYINTWLNGYFYNSLDSDIQNNILDNTFNIGERTAVDEITIAQKVGLLDDNQYKRAGGRNSYLHIQDNYWLGGPFDVVYNDDSVILDDPQGVRPVIFLKNNLNFISGNGTTQSPYELQ